MKFKTLLSLAAGAVMLAAGSSAALAEKLVISNWDGYMPKDMAEKFKAATGIDLEIAVHATNEEIMGKIPNLSNLYPEATELAYDPGNTFSVPYAWGTTGICYRSDLIDEPTSWNAILSPDADSKGKVTQMTTERWLALPALKSLGYSINTTDDAQLQEAKDLLIASKDDLLAYDDTTFYSRLVSGEANAVVAWDGWCNYGIAEDPNIKFVVPKEGSDLWVDTMVVLKSSKNKEAAHAFINYILDPANHAWVAENILYKVPNKAAMDAVGAELAKSFPNMGTTPADLLKGESLVDLGDAGPMYTKIATEVTSS